MELVKVDNYYISDLVWYIIKKYPSIRGSVYYHIFKEEFITMTIGLQRKEQLSYIEDGIKNSIRMDQTAKKKKDDKTRAKAAAMCMALMDLI